MGKTIELPLWLLLLILLFAAVTAATHMLFPSVRWFFRRRAERLVARLNERLERPIQPFKLLRRQDMIQRVIYDPEVVRAVGEYAESEGVREDVAFEKARDYAREIVPSFSASAYFGIAIRLSRRVANMLFDVRLSRVDDEALQNVDQNATLVFVMNHRSNFDYVLVTYLAASQSALSYAVGEWARVWPLSRLIRAMGAYFIRRRSRNGLYRKVLSSYVQKATEAGVSQAVFPEGGLSRDGRVGAPKLGILSYIVEGWRGDGRDVVFVPVSLNYDRVVEDRVLVAAGRTGQKKFRGSILEGCRFALRYLWRRATGKVDRFGVAAVTFGRPVSLAAMADEQPGDLVQHLARKLHADISAAVPVTTTALVLRVLIAAGKTLTVPEISAAMDATRPQLPASAVDHAAASSDPEKLERVLSILTLRHIVEKGADGYSIKTADLAEFYAASIDMHFSNTIPFALAKKSEET